MKYMTEYRSPELVEALLKEIKSIITKDWRIMEVCGGQTHSLVRNGLLSLLPKEITMIHGPGCPVCVTPVGLIDQAVELSLRDNVIMCSFGDMLRVPGTDISLLEAKARGADVRILYSPLEAVNFAKNTPEKEVIFFAVGFETTAPANALSVIHAHRQNIKNFSILTSHVLVPPAMEAVINDPECTIDAFLAAGHVCAIMGLDEYYPIVDKYKLPIVVTGFEPVDLLEGILMTIKQLEAGRRQLENQYSRIVPVKGNEIAQQTILDVFEIVDREWRGIGNIPKSGLELKPEFEIYNARTKFSFSKPMASEDTSCRSGDVMKGKIKPHQCEHFGKKCTPTKPLGAPMVSSEGACAAYFHFQTELTEH